MKHFHKRIIAGVFAVVTLFFSCIPPVYAAEVEVSADLTNVDFWTFIQSNTLSNVVNPFRSLLDKDVCSRSPNVNARHNFVEQHTQVDGKTGYYYICEYCGKSAGEVGKEAYNNQVSELPVTGYMSDGSLLWSPSHRDMYVWYSDRNSNTYYSCCPHCNSSDHSVSSEFTATFDCDKLIVNVYPVTGGQSFYLSYIDFRFTGTCPVSGIYYLLDGPCQQGYAIKSSGDRKSVNAVYSADKGAVYQASFPLSIARGATLLDSKTKAFSFIFLQGFAPVYRVEPLDSVGNTYNVTTRPTSITGGNYGIVGDNGTINTVTDNRSIVNETNNTYYNPATGETVPIANWSYDYSDRSYTVTLEGGDTVNVTYGDENITITENNVAEGDTIVNSYIIYYMMEGAGSGGPAICIHDWQETSCIEAICTASGRLLYTCSQCGEIRISTLPALDHDWVAVRAVPTEYDESGILIQEGYTLYECTRCGAQYKNVDSTGPPDAGINDGGLIEWLNGLIKSLSDNLSGAVELILRFFSEIPGLFGGFLDFLSAMFPYLPDDIIFLFTFGLAALVFIGVMKAIRR